MAITNLLQGNDAIITQFTDYWNANAAAATDVGTVPVIIYEDRETSIPANGTAWVELVIRNNAGQQASLSGDVQGSRAFRDFGIVTAQVRAPELTGRTVADQLAQVARDAFEGQTAGDRGEIWFRDVRINEFGEENNWFRIDVLADFEYDRVK